MPTLPRPFPDPSPTDNPCRIDGGSAHIPSVNLAILRQSSRGHSLVVRSDVVSEHLSASRWQRLHDDQVLVVVHRGVSRFVDAPATFEQSAMAAALACGAGSMVAGPTAARLWGAESAFLRPAHVILPGRARVVSRPGIIVHRPTDGAGLGRRRHHGIATVGPLRAVVDTAAWAPSLLRPVIEELIVARRITISDLRRAASRPVTRGRPGNPALRRALLDWSLGERPADSVLESRMGDLLRDHGISMPVFQHRLGSYRPDFTWLAEMAILECDGWADHGRDRAGFERDRERDAWLHAQGYVVWRFTWRQITQRSHWVAERVATSLASRRRQLNTGSGKD